MQKKIKFLFLFLFLFFFLLNNSSVYALTLDNLHVMNDNYFESAYPTANYSGTVSWQLKERSSPNGYTQAYMMFNISEIPPNVTITNAYISGWQLYSRTGSFYVLAYNTSLNWTTINISFGSIANGVLQSNTSTDFTHGSITHGRKNWTVTDAVKSAYERGIGIVSITLRPNEDSSATLKWGDFARASYGVQGENLIIEYNITDCGLSCGTCGCDNDTGCYTPPIIGSYCAIEDGMEDTIKTVYSNCTTKYFDCPSGTACTQITPVYNLTTVPDQGSGTSGYCDGCWFINSPFGYITNHWGCIATNCPTKIGVCDCQGAFCSGYTYSVQNITNVAYDITNWTAGCYLNGFLINIINSTGQNTTMDALVKESCPDCVLNDSVFANYTCPSNTTTQCYDSICNPVKCNYIVGSACSSNYAGQLALNIGGLLGVTDCGLSQNILALIISMAIGFFILVYIRDSEHSGQAFIFGTLIPLILFTVVSWFPSWLMIVIIVISGYIVAKSIGIGGN